MNKIVVGLSLVAAAFMPVLANAEDAKAQAPAAAETSAATAAAPIEVGNKICPVSGEKIKKNAMGGPVTIEHNGKMYGLCCSMCIKDFKKDPDKYAAIADKEVSGQK